ncbi:hypothetical protein CVT25_009400 [Psilocybe cyanescens]|uniref:Uncharacterized protein n=1 Tax=Psilocybe cyanescens TaxID=93625 RepID=A0A409WW24_PSICY|nr:hypothetical protein CVT25_009400 [Psilocybe cyanescens]
MKVYGELSPQTPGVFKLIVDHSIRWKTLDIISTEQYTEILNTARGRTPILESVYIHSTGMQLQKAPLKILEDAPNLRSLHCVGIRSIVVNTNPWMNLVSFTSETSSDTILPFLFSYAPNLQHLRIQATSFSEPGTPSSSTNARNSQDASSSDKTFILPPRLVSLVIKGWHTSQYIRRLEAPSSLQRLSIIQQGKEGLIQYSFTPVANFIERAKCNLLSFGISTEVLPIDVESLHYLFSKLDSVTRLYVDLKTTSNYKAMMHQIPQMLDPIPDSSLSINPNVNGVALPSLQVLYYSLIDSGVKSQHIIDMIKHRCKGQDDLNGVEITPGQCAKLKVVRFNKTNPKVLLEYLQEEIAKGLEVTYDLPYKGEPFE